MTIIFEWQGVTTEMKFSRDCSLNVAFHLWYDKKYGEELPEKDQLDFHVGLEIYQAYGVSEERRFRDLNNFNNTIKVTESVAYEDIYFVD